MLYNSEKPRLPSDDGAAAELEKLHVYEVIVQSKLQALPVCSYIVWKQRLGGI